MEKELTFEKLYKGINQSFIYAGFLMIFFAVIFLSKKIAMDLIYGAVFYFAIGLKGFVEVALISEEVSLRGCLFGIFLQTALLLLCLISYKFPIVLIFAAISLGIDIIQLLNMLKLWD